MPVAFIESIGGGELLVIFIVALLLFGAQRLPGLARQLGRGVEHLRRSAQQVREEFMVADHEIRDDMDEEGSSDLIETDLSDQPDQPDHLSKPTAVPGGRASNASQAPADPTEGQDGGGI